LEVAVAAPESKTKVFLGSSVNLMDFVCRVLLSLYTYTRCVLVVEHRFELADGPASRSDGPRSGQSAPVGRTVRACVEQFRFPSFVLWLLDRFVELARNSVV
jgi:hypothetical protein